MAQERERFHQLENNYRNFILHGNVSDLGKIEKTTSAIVDKPSLPDFIASLGAFVDACEVPVKGGNNRREVIKNPSHKRNAEVISQLFVATYSEQFGRDFTVSMPLEQRIKIAQEIVAIVKKYQTLKLQLPVFTLSFLQVSGGKAEGILSQFVSQSRSTSEDVHLQMSEEMENVLKKIDDDPREEARRMIRGAAEQRDVLHKLTVIDSHAQDAHLHLQLSRKNINAHPNIGDSEITQLVIENLKRVTYLTELSKKGSLPLYQQQDLDFNLLLLQIWVNHIRFSEMNKETKQFLDRIESWRSKAMHNFVDPKDEGDREQIANLLATASNTHQALISDQHINTPSPEKGFIGNLALEMIIQLEERFSKGMRDNPFVGFENALPPALLLQSRSIPFDEGFKAAAAYYLHRIITVPKNVDLFTRLTSSPISKSASELQVSYNNMNEAYGGIFGGAEAVTLEEKLQDRAINGDAQFVYEYLDSEVRDIYARLSDRANKGSLYYLPTGSLEYPVRSTVQLQTNTTELAAVGQVFKSPSLEFLGGNPSRGSKVIHVKLTDEQRSPIYASIIIDDSIRTQLWIADQEYLPLTSKAIELLIVSVFSKLCEKNVDYSIIPHIPGEPQQGKKSAGDTREVRYIPPQDHYYKYQPPTDEFNPVSSEELVTVREHRHLLPYGRKLLQTTFELEEARRLGHSQAKTAELEARQRELFKRVGEGVSLKTLSN